MPINIENIILECISNPNILAIKDNICGNKTNNMSIKHANIHRIAYFVENFPFLNK